MQRSLRDRLLDPSMVLPGLLGLDFVLRFLVALRPLKYIDGLTIPDDAYLSLTIARNMARGLGPWYGMDFTNGFQPLYVLLMVPVYKLFHGNPVVPVHIALVLLIVFDVLALYFLYRLVALATRSTAAPVFVAVAWILNPYVIRTTLNGLETAIAFFFIVLAFYYFYRHDLLRETRKSVRRALILGLVLGLGILARIDVTIVVFGFLAAMAIDAIRSRCFGRRFVPLGAAMLAGVAFVYLPWMLYSFSFTGDIYPVSGKAVRYMSLATVGHAPTLMNWYLPMVGKGLAALLRCNWFYLTLIGGLVGAEIVWKIRAAFESVALQLPAGNGRMGHRPNGGPPLSGPILLFSVILFFIYTCHVFADWFFDRYLFPLVLPLLLVLGILFDRLCLRLKGRPRLVKAAFGVLIVGSVAQPAYFVFYSTHDALSLRYLQPALPHLYGSRETRKLGYMNLGLWSNRHFPNGTRVGCSQTGALGYFAENLTIINLDGVVNKRCYESLVRRRNLDYIRDMGIEYVIGWGLNINFIKAESQNFKQSDLVLRKKITDFESWNYHWYVYEVNYEGRRPPQATGHRP
jgi:hypothetical protein